MPDPSFSPSSRSPGTFARVWLVTVALALSACVAPALSQTDPPGRVGRVALTEGAVQLLPGADPSGRPAAPVDQARNWPLTTGDLLQVGPNSRTEVTIGSTWLRLGERSRLQVLQLDDQVVRLHLLEGSIALRLRTEAAARDTDVLAGTYQMSAAAPGLFRIDVEPAMVAATAWQADWRVAGPQGAVTLRPGQRLLLDAGGSQWRHAAPVADRFAAWAMVDDIPLARTDLVSPEMTGQEDLARHGEWQDSSEWGPVWMPRGVATDWAPYRDGRWAWVAPWGWTWVDAAPWGFAPFHYGRWVQWRQRWAWVPGAYQARPVYAPALVGGGMSVIVGGTGRPAPPPVWHPLSPRDPYVPSYRSSRDHWEHLNRPHLPDPGRDERRRLPVAPQRPVPSHPEAGGPLYNRGFPPPDTDERRRAPTPEGRSVFGPAPGGVAPALPVPSPRAPQMPAPAPAAGLPAPPPAFGRQLHPVPPPGAAPAVVPPPAEPRNGPGRELDQRRRLPAPVQAPAAPVISMPAAPAAPSRQIGGEPRRELPRTEAPSGDTRPGERRHPRGAL